jgi:type IV secretion system protein VirB4
MDIKGKLKELFSNYIEDAAFDLKKVDEIFFPYACHYDPETILTKNGELLQTIRITGYSEDILGEEISLRELIRKTILENIQTNKFAIWFHTVRRRINLQPPAIFPNQFSKDLNESWSKKNYWQDKYVNEQYITILCEGNNLDGKTLTKGEFFSKSELFKKQNKRMEEVKNTLSKAVDGILASLKGYGAYRLAAKEDRHGFRCEILEFFIKVAFLHERRMDMPILDLSSYLSFGKTVFGDNTFQVVANEKKFFGSMLTIKDYQSFDESLIDGVMRLPQEYIITETLTFTDSKETKKSFEKANKVLKISKDEWLYEKSGLKKTIESDKGNKTDYGLSQLSMMVISDSIPELENCIANTIQQFNKLGIVIIREDINMENLFWSQLPGNFSFMSRRREINTSKVNEFASLYNSPKGKLESKWGACISIFKLADGTPYFFNFHKQDNGHTLILGSVDTQKNLLCNFLISESTKHHPNIFYIDENGSGKLLIKALGGKYLNPALINAKTGEKKYYCNPLLLGDNKENRDFLLQWLKLLIKDSQVEDSVIKAIIDDVYKLDKSKRQLKYAEEFIKDASLLEKLKAWRGEGPYAHIFDNDKDDFDLSFKIMGFSLQAEDGSPLPLEVQKALVLYYIHKFSNKLDGTPSMLILNDVLPFLNDGDVLSKDNLPEWLEYLTYQNATIMCVANSDLKNIQQIEFNNYLSTIMFMSNSRKLYNFNEFTQLNSQEVNDINKMAILHRHFYIRQGKDNYTARLNLDGLNNVISVLAGFPEFIKLMDEAILEKADDPTKWLSTYYIKLDAEMRRISENAIF